MSELGILAQNVFCRCGGNLLSATHTARLTAAELSSVLEVENLELIEKPISEGKGVVLLLGHMGNWELLSRLTHFFPDGTKTGAFYRPLNNELMDARILRQREADGTRMFSKRDPFHQVTGFLRAGGVVGVLADQRVGYSGDLVEFYGRRTRMSPLPSLLARRSKSEVLALSLMTVAPGKWRARFYPVTKPYDTNHCMAALEAAMRQSPEDVFWLHARWRVLMAKKHNLVSLLGDPATSGKKPYRALVWLEGCGQSWELPEEWLHADVVYEYALALNKRPSSLSPDDILHVVEFGLNSGDYLRLLRDIDESSDYPLDFVVTHPDARELLAASKEMDLPAYPRL